MSETRSTSDPPTSANGAQPDGGAPVDTEGVEPETAETETAETETAETEEDQAPGSTDVDFGSLTRGDARELLRLMLVSRRLEEKCAESYQVGKIGGFLHLYIGQEAVAAGSISPLRDDDYVITAYRDHVQALMRGISARSILAELYGRVDGCSKGFGGSMHLFDKSVNFLGGHGIVGGQLPLAIGVGYAIRYRESDQVCVCYFGDSVVNIGSFHESLNMAARWGLPVVFILENNSYGMGTPIERVAAADELVQRGAAFSNLESVVANGMDLLDVRRVTEEAIERARTDKVPTYIEARCYRYMGHSMADPSHGTYRTREEWEKWRGDDPIQDLSSKLISAGWMSEEEYEEMDRSAIAEIEDAAEFADNSPAPEPPQIYSSVYSDTYADDLARRDRWRPEFEGGVD